jgi:hypothetical protein
VRLRHGDRLEIATHRFDVVLRYLISVLNKLNLNPSPSASNAVIRTHLLPSSAAARILRESATSAPGVCPLAVGKSQSPAACPLSGSGEVTG